MTTKTTGMVYSWLATDHARLHVVTTWPESTQKETLLIAIRSSIQRLRNDPESDAFLCFICGTALQTLEDVSPRSLPDSDAQRRAA